METNGHDPPNEREWAAATLKVDRYDDAESTVLHLQKAICKHGKTYLQSIWLTMPQLRAMAEDQLSRP